MNICTFTSLSFLISLVCERRVQVGDVYCSRRREWIWTVDWKVCCIDDEIQEGSCECLSRRAYPGLSESCTTEEEGVRRGEGLPKRLALHRDEFGRPLLVLEHSWHLNMGRHLSLKPSCIVTYGCPCVQVTNIKAVDFLYHQIIHTLVYCLYEFMTPTTNRTHVKNVSIRTPDFYGDSQICLLLGCHLCCD